jgi:hypothetical protein
MQFCAKRGGIVFLRVVFGNRLVDGQCCSIQEMKYRDEEFSKGGC